MQSIHKDNMNGETLALVKTGYHAQVSISGEQCLVKEWDCWYKKPSDELAYTIQICARKTQTTTWSEFLEIMCFSEAVFSSHKDFRKFSPSEQNTLFVCPALGPTVEESTGATDFHSLGYMLIYLQWAHDFSPVAASQWCWIPIQLNIISNAPRNECYPWESVIFL